jgi:NADH-ubiquinone oxidoreductase complex I, 21 kDa subunit
LTRRGRNELSTGHGTTVHSFIGHSRSWSLPRAPRQTSSKFTSLPCVPLIAKKQMPDKVVETPYPLIDADPHFSRVVRYMRPSDYVVWAGATAAFPSALYLWGKSIPLQITHSSYVLIQRWLILQKRVYGQLYASVACLVVLAAFYLPTNGQAVSFCNVHCPTQPSILPPKFASGDGQRTSTKRKRTLPS